LASANEADEQALLQRINRLVNGRVRQRTDLEIYGQAEVWRRSGIGKGAAGDCEDLAIEKRFELADAGFPADRLSFAVVYARGIGLHTVLVARLSSGDYVLDSRSPYIQPWADAPYSWIALQSTEDPMAWHAVTGGGRKA
jgi:predicted transglutaminase-like cysteine proteinase